MNNEYMIGALGLQVKQLEAMIGLTPDTYVQDRLQAAKKELADAEGYLRTPIAPAVRFNPREAITV